MHESHAVTILARRFPAKRAFITGAGSGLARRFMQGSRFDAGAAARAILAAAAGRTLYVVWPREYRWAWRLKRAFPLWFLRRLETLRDAQLVRSNPRPR